MTHEVAWNTTGFFEEATPALVRVCIGDGADLGACDRDASGRDAWDYYRVRPAMMSEENHRRLDGQRN